MSLVLYDTMSRQKRTFTPKDPARVTMYVCGPTVYNFAHIGNFRPVVVFDVLFRLLRHIYGEAAVQYAANVTDVDDKINRKAADEGVPISTITDRYLSAYNADAAALGEMLRTIATCRKPTIARVQGDAYAGGVGLVAACDIAVAADGVHFCLSEVKLGLIPATIAPYVVRAMGAHAAQRYCLTAERFDAATALRIGVVHEVAPADALDARVQPFIDAFLAASPQALADCKRLLAEAERLARDEWKLPAMRMTVIDLREELIAFYERRGYRRTGIKKPFPATIVIDELRQSFVSYGVDGVPTFVLVDGDGKVASYQSGYLGSLGVPGWRWTSDQEAPR